MHNAIAHARDGDVMGHAPPVGSGHQSTPVGEPEGGSSKVTTAPANRRGAMDDRGTLRLPFSVLRLRVVRMTSDPVSGRSTENSGDECHVWADGRTR